LRIDDGGDVLLLACHDFPPVRGDELAPLV
jgi:hypothetical protein